MQEKVSRVYFVLRDNIYWNIQGTFTAWAPNEEIEDFSNCQRRHWRPKAIDGMSALASVGRLGGRNRYLLQELTVVSSGRGGRTRAAATRRGRISVAHKRAQREEQQVTTTQHRDCTNLGVSVCHCFVSRTARYTATHDIQRMISTKDL